ncbi:MAG: hypothetical protein ABI627_19520 [Polyangiaceae bacterium]
MVEVEQTAEPRAYLNGAEGGVIVARRRQWLPEDDEVMGIKSRDDFASHIDDVLSNASGADVRSLTGGRSAYWDDSNGTVVIRDPGAPDLGTAFRPTMGRAYFNGLR